jgi:hypothetical protein
MELYFLPVLFMAGVVVVNTYRWWSDPRNHARRVLRRAKTTPIGGIKEGQWVKVSGIVEAIGPPLTATVSERRCVGFRVVVERLKRGYPVIFRREDCGAFSIADDTGIAVVEGPFVFGLDWENDWSTVSQEGLGSLEQAGVSTEGLFLRRRFAFREALLMPGDRVSIRGLVHFEPDPTEPAAGFRSPAFRAHLRGSEAEPVVVADAGSGVGR